MKVLFGRVWRGNINRASMRLFPSLSKAVSHAVEDCKAEARGNRIDARMDAKFEANFIQAYEVFEDREPRLIRDFKQRVEEAIGS